MQLIEAQADIVEHADGDRAVRRVTHFSQDFLDNLKSQRLASEHLRNQEINKVAEVPTHLIDMWMAQGFDFYRMTPKQIVAKLQRDGLETFITTTKSL